MNLLKKQNNFRYQVVLDVENMHNTDDAAQMTWYIYCANPVIPDDWEVVFDPFQHVTTFFTIDFKMKKEEVAILPTQPIIRLIGLTGDQRIDNNIEFDNATVYQFATLDNAGELPFDFPDGGCEDFFILEKMGIDPNSGWMSDGVMQSDSAGKMGDVYGEKFTIYVPVQNHPDFTEGKIFETF